MTARDVLLGAVHGLGIILQRSRGTSQIYSVFVFLVFLLYTVKQKLSTNINQHNFEMFLEHHIYRMIVL